MTDLYVLNDTTKELILRVNLKDALPSVTKVKPLNTKLIKVQSEDVLVKLWDNNVLLIQERQNGDLMNSQEERIERWGDLLDMTVAIWELSQGEVIQ